MNEFLPHAPSVAGFLLTYLFHSTAIVLLMTLVAQQRWATRARVALWKVALVLPLLTTCAVQFTTFAQWGPNLVLASRSNGQDGLSQRALSPEALATTRERPGFEGSHDSLAVEYDLAPNTRFAAGDALNSTPQAQRSESVFPFWSCLIILCAAGSLLGAMRLGLQWVNLTSLRRRSQPLVNSQWRNAFFRVQSAAQLTRPVLIAESHEVDGPIVGGIWRPFVLVPTGFLQTLNKEQRDALFAHELLHIARRDITWKLWGQILCRLLFFQPLNRFARRRLEMETEFIVDQQAARLLRQQHGLAGCLGMLGEWLLRRRNPGPFNPLTAGMASFRSTLGKRVEALLADNSSAAPSSRGTTFVLCALVIATALSATAYIPRAVADQPKPPLHEQGNQSMVRSLTSLAVLASLVLPAAADEKKEKPKPKRPPITKKTADALPKGVARFNGMIVGRLVKKDVEKGRFIINVDAVPRVWRNSKATDPKSIVGKNIEVDGVFGKWLDVLLVVKEGETLECEAKHDGGERLTFPGELLRKVAPFDPTDYPVLPEKFRGFSGAIAAKIIKKDPMTYELIVQVDRVLDTFKNNEAKQAKSIEGKRMMLAGFWRRKEQYAQLKVGDNIEVGMRHIGMRSDHLTVSEFVRKAGKRPGKPTPRSTSNLPEGIHGFMGSLVGRLLEKDVEKGTLMIQVDAVPRVWRNNKASKPKSIVGKKIRIEGISNRLLDVLLTTRKGETIEVAGRHDRGDSLTFPGELFRKVAPFKAEDYPVLPDGFRGFKGEVTARIVKKDKQMFGLIVRVEKIGKLADRSGADKAESVVGKNIMLAGFWRRKESYAGLKVGDVIQTAVQHQIKGTDIVSVTGNVRKAAQTERRDRP